MSRSASNAVIDGTLNVIATAGQMHACTAEPTTFTEATVTYSLGSGNMTGIDFSLSDDVSGRKLTVAEQVFNIDAAGTCTHVALVTGSDLLFVTTTNSIALNPGELVAIESFEVNVQDPVAP